MPQAQLYISDDVLLDIYYNNKSYKIRSVMYNNKEVYSLLRRSQDFSTIFNKAESLIKGTPSTSIPVIKVDGNSELQLIEV